MQKKEWDVSSNFRFQKSEQVDLDVLVPHVNSGFHNAFTFSYGLVCDPGFKGQIFSYFYLTKSLKVFSFHGGRMPFPIQGVCIWPIHSTKSIYQMSL